MNDDQELSKIKMMSRAVDDEDDDAEKEKDPRNRCKEMMSE